MLGVAGGNEVVFSDSLNGLADVVLMQGDIAQVRALYWDALALPQSLGDR